MPAPRTRILSLSGIGTHVRFGKYLKAAFTNRWNLLAFLGASAFALLSPWQDAGMALVLAGEITWLGLLANHPRFQSAVDAQEAMQARQSGSDQAQRALERITQALPKDSLNRFQSLRAQCVELQQIARELQNPTDQSTSPLGLEDFQIEGLDRLLWIHLRLLYTHYALSRFLQRTTEDQIQLDIRRAEERLAALPPAQGGDQKQRVRKALEDNLQTSKDRLANLLKARDNFELVKLEIERLENKIRALSEVAVNRHEPEFITGQVDQVARSMLDTERTMNELQFATGLVEVDEPPELLRPAAVQFQK